MLKKPFGKAKAFGSTNILIKIDMCPKKNHDIRGRLKDLIPTKFFGTKKFWH